jgi:hypothetical protein
MSMGKCEIFFEAFRTRRGDLILGAET